MTWCPICGAADGGTGCTCDTREEPPRPERDLPEYVARQLRHVGVAAIALTDGHMFFFTRGVLVRLLEASESSGAEDRVSVFIPKGWRS